MTLRHRLGRVLSRLPVAQEILARRGGAPPPPGALRWGGLRRSTPLSRDWGYDRGTPIDRVYIESFLARQATDVRGACLEVMNDAYTVRYGDGRVTSRDVLDIDPANLAATVVADLNEPDSLPPARFDCVVFTQTLHLIPDMTVAMGNVWRALAPGGVLLLTVPVLGRHDIRKGFHHDRWRVTPTGLRWLLDGLAGASVEITTYGTVLTCTAFLYGVAAEELTAAELSAVDPGFPLIVGARVVKEPAA